MWICGIPFVVSPYLISGCAIVNFAVCRPRSFRFAKTLSTSLTEVTGLPSTSSTVAPLHLDLHLSIFAAGVDFNMLASTKFSPFWMNTMPAV